MQCENKIKFFNEDCGVKLENELIINQHDVVYNKQIGLLGCVGKPISVKFSRDNVTNVDVKHKSNSIIVTIGQRHVTIPLTTNAKFNESLINKLKMFV